MAGTYSAARAGASTAWHQPAVSPLFGRGFDLPLPAARGYVQAVGARGPGELAGLVLPGFYPNADEADSTTQKTVSRSLGWATIGAGLVAAFVPAQYAMTRRTAQVGFGLLVAYGLLEGKLK